MLKPRFSMILVGNSTCLLVLESCSILDWSITIISKHVTSRQKAKAKEEILSKEKSKRARGRILEKKVSLEKRMRRMRKNQMSIRETYQPVVTDHQ